MKYCKLCHWLLQGRRWLLFPLALTFTLFVPLFAPVWLFLLLLSLQLLSAAMCAIYLRDMLHFTTPEHLRMPAPHDAHPEIVMIDAALLDHGPVMVGMAQPATPALEMHPSQGEGVKLLAGAICMVNTLLPRHDAQALINACRTQMNLTPTDMLTKHPVLSRGTEEGMKCITVQEEDAERTYFVGDAQTVLDACSRIHNRDEHLMSADERARIRGAAKDMSASGEHLYAFATALGDDEPTFLGLAAVGDDVDLAVIDHLQELRRMGMTLVLRDDSTRYMDVPVLRRNLGIPDLHARPDIHLCITNPYPDRHTLPIIRHADRNLVQPLKDLSHLFENLSIILRRLFRIMTLCLLCCVLAGGLHSALAVTAILATGYLTFGSLYTSRSIRPAEIMLTGAACLLIRLLLDAAAPAAQDFAGTLLCMTLTFMVTFTLRKPKQPMSLPLLLPLLGVTVLFVLLQVMLSWSVLAVSVLPALFCIVCAAAMGCYFLLIRK